MKNRIQNPGDYKESPQDPRLSLCGLKLLRGAGRVRISPKFCNRGSSGRESQQEAARSSVLLKFFDRGELTGNDAWDSGFVPFVVGEAVFDRSLHSHLTSLFELNAKYATVIILEEAGGSLAKIPQKR